MESRVPQSRRRSPASAVNNISPQALRGSMPPVVRRCVPSAGGSIARPRRATTRTSGSRARHYMIRPNHSIDSITDRNAKTAAAAAKSAVISDSFCSKKIRVFRFS